MLPNIDVFRMFPDTLVAYQDHALLVTDVHGHLGKGIEGLYYHQTRLLSRVTFTVDGRPPLFVSANAVDSYSFIGYYLASAANAPQGGAQPDDPNDDGGGIVGRGIEIQVNRFIGDGCHQDVILTNRTRASATITLAWQIDADYTDLNEAIEGRRTQNAPIERTWRQVGDHAELEFRYRHPQLDHGTIVAFPRVQMGPVEQDGEVRYTLTLKPGEPLSMCFDVLPIFQGRRIVPIYDCQSFRSHDTAWDHARDRLVAQMARLETPAIEVQFAWERALGDLASLPLLEGEGDRRYTPAAGIPLYQALFGRDTLTTSWQAGWANPLMLRGTILTIADWLGKKVDDRFDEQPGRVMHQHQLSPLSLLGHNPFLHYYGDYAGPGMFLVAIAWYFALTGDRDFVRDLRTSILAVLDWMDRDGDRDGDGFYEYATRAPVGGTKNQGWKDSGDAILTHAGDMVDNPIAVVEIQGYYYAAKQLMGLVFMALGELGRGTRLLAEASDLKKRFNQAFWMPDERFYALALGPDKRQVRSIASNVGQALACGIIDNDKAADVAQRLMAPDLFSGWGIRTLSSEHPAYNPFSYHLGSVWPSENGSIALGLRRYGFKDEMQRLVKGLFDATRLFNQSRLPEVIGGHQRDPAHPHPGIYPNSCAPQAWSASAVIMLVETLLGLVPMAPLHLLMVDPSLPEWLPELKVHDVAIGGARVSLHFKRGASGKTDYRVIAKQGRLRVARMSPPNALEVGIGTRFGEIARAMVFHR